MLQMTLIDPRQTVYVDSGYALDAIGALSDVDLPRRAGETDISYRNRLAVRLWEWRGPTHDGPTTGLPDEPQPNHVRDAVHSNR